MSNKAIRVMEEYWDYLIVLDACRFDYFSEIYRDYFSGELEKRLSLGSNTPEWCERSFPDHYSDVIYISGNPYINSRLEVDNFDAEKHFYKVVDVWDSGWNEELGTVPPEQMNKSFLSCLRKFPEKRFIVHYLQPHEPYLSSKFDVHDLLEHRRYKNGLKWAQGHWQDPLEKILRLLFVKTRIMKNTWNVREFLNLHVFQPMEAVKRRYGEDGLREAYRENIRIVLEYVNKLCMTLLLLDPSKSILITSDHGELLGENGDYCHERGSVNPHLIEVPLLKVNKVETTPITTEREMGCLVPQEDEKRIKGRLRALGYID